MHGRNLLPARENTAAVCLQVIDLLVHTSLKGRCLQWSLGLVWNVMHVDAAGHQSTAGRGGPDCPHQPQHRHCSDVSRPGWQGVLPAYYCGLRHAGMPIRYPCWCSASLSVKYLASCTQFWEGILFSQRRPGCLMFFPVWPLKGGQDVWCSSLSGPWREARMSDAFPCLASERRPVCLMFFLASERRLGMSDVLSGLWKEAGDVWCSALSGPWREARMSDVLPCLASEGSHDVWCSPMSSISGLSFNSPFLSPLLFFCLFCSSVLSFFC